MTDMPDDTMRARGESTAEGEKKTIFVTRLSHQWDTADSELVITDAASVTKPPRTIRGVRWILVVAAILSSMFTQSLDNTVAADLVPAITGQFHAVDLLPWVSVGFTFGAFVSLLPMGKLYARVDNKHVYVASLLLFSGASALCGAAPSMTALIVGRFLLGVGGSGLYCGIMTLFTNLADEHEVPLYFSLTGLVWCVGTVLGPVVGGAFASINDTTWRWSFYINLIICGVFLPVYLFVLPSVDPLASEPSSKKTACARFRNFDWLGCLLLAGSSICLIMAINLGGVLYEWDSASIPTLFVIGGVLFGAFILQQRLAFLTTRADRIFPAELLARREPALLFVASISANVASFIPVYYIPLYFQFARGDTALQAAVRLLPLIFLFGAVNLAQGMFLLKVGYYWPWFCAGGLLAFAGNLMLYFSDVDTSTSYLYGAEAVMAIGAGLCNQTAYGVIHGVIPPAYIRLGVPFVMIAQYTGITFGLSISGAVFVNGALKGLAHLLPNLSQAQLSTMLAGTAGESIKLVPPELHGAVIEILVQNLRKTFAVAFSGAAVVFLTSLGFKGKMASGGPPVMAG